MSRESNDSRNFFSQLIDDYVDAEPSPTEKQRKWREVTRYRLTEVSVFCCCCSALFVVELYRLVAGLLATA